MVDVLGRVLGSYAAMGSPDPIIRERDQRDQRETPMTFSYGSDADPLAADGATDAAEQTASDPADSTRTARRDCLSEDAAAELLRQIDGPPPSATRATGDRNANATQELSADDILEMESQAETLEIKGEQARDTAEDLAPEPSGTLPSLPPSPESTPTLPTSEAPKTPALAAAAARALAAIDESRDPAPVTTKPPSQPPSTMPTMLAPKSLGLPTRKHTNVLEDRVRDLRTQEKAPVTRRSNSAFTAVTRADSSVAGTAPSQRVTPIISAPAPDRSSLTNPATSVPRTQPYPFASPVDPELAPVTEPASLPIPLFPEIPVAAQSVPFPLAPQSVPFPLARMIETSIESVGARPTLESAQPLAVFPPPGSRDPLLDAPVRPLVLPDLSGAVPVLTTFDPRLAHVDYAEGLARRQQAERAAAVRAIARTGASHSVEATPRSPTRRSRALFLAFAASAALIAATLFCAAIMLLRQAPPTAASASSPIQARAKIAAQPSPNSKIAASKSPVSIQPSIGSVANLGAAAGAPAEDKGIPVLAVDLLPRAPSSRGVLHVGKQFDGHRVFVDGSVVGNGSGDYELVCGRHGVKIGSQDRSRPILVPCGGDISL